MTQEEAYQRLELPEGTDIQEVHRQFTALQNDYRAQIDTAPTPRMRQFFGQQLEQIKEAYSLLGGSKGMNDTVDLPRTGRSGHNPESHQPVTGETVDLKKALTYFGLSLGDNIEKIRRTIREHITELTRRSQASELTPYGERYERDLRYAYQCKAVVRKVLREEWGTETPDLQPVKKSTKSFPALKSPEERSTYAIIERVVSGILALGITFVVTHRFTGRGLLGYFILFILFAVTIASHICLSRKAIRIIWIILIAIYLLFVIFAILIKIL